MSPVNTATFPKAHVLVVIFFPLCQSYLFLAKVRSPDLRSLPGSCGVAVKTTNAGNSGTYIPAVPHTGFNPWVRKIR